MSRLRALWEALWIVWRIYTSQWSPWGLLALVYALAFLVILGALTLHSALGGCDHG